MSRSKRERRVREEEIAKSQYQNQSLFEDDQHETRMRYEKEKEKVNEFNLKRIEEKKRRRELERVQR